MPSRPRKRDDIRIAIICALPLEAEMVQSVFDKDWENEEDIDLGQAEGDQNAYSIGTIGKHNVVLAYMPGMGNTDAAAVAVGLRSSYHRIEVAFVVGICGVTPKHPVTQKEIILGDCIISTTTIQYDFGRQYPGVGTFKRKTDIKDTLGRADPGIRAMVNKLQTAPNLKHLSSGLEHHLEALQQEHRIEYPGCHEDRLFRNSYAHKHHDDLTCDDCIGDIGTCEKDCEELKCSESELITRDRLNVAASLIPQPQLHFGCYGSANSVLRSGEHREHLVTKERIVAFEMEGAGVWDNLPTIIIKSACDYADSHKNKKWQRYAAATAAAGLKSILKFWRTTDVVQEYDNRADPAFAGSSTNDSILEADKIIREYYHSGNRLLIERLSGEELELEKCFINLALIERGQDKEERSSFALSARLRLDASDIGESIALNALFKPRQLSNGTNVTPRRIFIQGRAGIGKTTLCKKIVHEFLGGRLGQELFDRLLWIPLRKLKIGQNFYGWRELLRDAYALTSPKWRQVNELYVDQFYERKFLDKTLLLFDGLDEISHQWKDNDPTYELLKTIICDAPNIIITSRPQANTFSIRYDLELETVGFTAEQVNTYIKNCVEDEKAIENMKALIAMKPLLQGLLRIPIQLDAFCYTWTSEVYHEGDSSSEAESGTSSALDIHGPSTMTMLYDAIVIALCKKDLKRQKKVDQSHRLNRYEVLSKLEKEMKSLAEFAFQGMTNNIIEFSPKHQDRVGAHLSQSSSEPPTFYSSDLEGLSFLRTSDSGQKDHSKQNYHFIHLTFQEFFAAKHFARHWLRGEFLTCLPLTGLCDNERKTPFRFLQEEKYNPRYNIFWRFVTGLIFEENGAVRFFSDLRAEPIDLLEATHRRLLMYCLSEVIPGQNQEVQKLYNEEAELLKQRLITESKVPGGGAAIYNEPDGIKLGTQAEFPEQILCDCLEDEVDLPYERTLSTIGQRSVVRPETLEIVAQKLETSFPALIRLQAAQVLLQNSTVCLPSLLEDAITVSISALKHENTDVRCAAGRTLQKQSSLPGIAVDALIAAAFKDKDYDVKENAARALWKQSASAMVVNNMIVKLRSADEKSGMEWPSTVTPSRHSLPKETIDVLIAAVKVEGHWVRCFALDMLEGQSLSKEAIDTIFAILQNKNEESDIRYGATKALRENFLSKEAIDTLFEMFQKKNETPDALYGIAKILSRNPLSEKAIDTLIAALENKNEELDMQWNAMQILGRQDLPDRVVNALVTILKGKDSTLGTSSALALEQQPRLSDENIDTLTTIFQNKEESSDRRGSALCALRTQSCLPEEAVNAMVTLIEDKEDGVRNNALCTLAIQSRLSQEAADVVIAGLRNKNHHRNRRSYAVKVIANQSHPSKENIKLLIATLKDEDVMVRDDAASGLRKHSPLTVESVRTLVEMLHEDNSEIYEILHYQEWFFPMIKDLDNRRWLYVWSAWLRRGLYNDVSCYELEGFLYIWAGGVRHLISSDPTQISRLREAIPKDSAIEKDCTEEDRTKEGRTENDRPKKDLSFLSKYDYIAREVRWLPGFKFATGCLGVLGTLVVLWILVYPG